MIDSKTLHDFLTANVHPELYPRLFVISRKGKLVAYSTKHDISRIEDEAALVAKAWRDTAQQQNPPPTPPPDSYSHSHSHSHSHNSIQPQPRPTSGSSTSHAPAKTTLTALTVQSSKHNILVRPIQSNLLLVLIGGVPPGLAARPFKITPETVATAAASAAAPPSPSDDTDLEKDVVALTAGAGPPAQKAAAAGRMIDVLRLQRRKIDMLAEAIFEEARVLRIPDDV